ncbi:hypothetical protein PAESOLCIP111_01577 [Paenibacillus solanacearum]|uniref:Uncharacterized protein n=1 Tax=Paenibacillus solanacearum TaxID=2048548 RepID=A0A916JXY3_9BACL|nr:hypothetical protein PAESOLCIP111_01577 [Paenibacillus solanacearum]
MPKRSYSKPAVLNHQLISFETLLSCNPPNIPGQRLDNGNRICLLPNGAGWFESK